MFHVPEGSRVTKHPTLASTILDGNNGAFLVPSPEPGWMLALICSDSSAEDNVPWEHVSVHAYLSRDSRKMRTPNWKEMAYVKDICWDDEDVVMQLHSKKSEYVNQHQFMLHLWRPINYEIPTPPSITVGHK